MAVHLDKAPHAWQVGLDDPAGRVCDTLVCPTEANIARLCLALGKAGLRAIPVVGYAHLTIDSRESKAEFGVGEIPKPFAWRATGILHAHKMDPVVGTIYQSDICCYLVITVKEQEHLATVQGTIDFKVFPVTKLGSPIHI